MLNCILCTITKSSNNNDTLPLSCYHLLPIHLRCRLLIRHRLPGHRPLAAVVPGCEKVLRLVEYDKTAENCLSLFNGGPDCPLSDIFLLCRSCVHVKSRDDWRITSPDSLVTAAVRSRCQAAPAAHVSLILHWVGTWHLTPLQTVRGSDASLGWVGPYQSHFRKQCRTLMTQPLQFHAVSLSCQSARVARNIILRQSLLAVWWTAPLQISIP